MVRVLTIMYVHLLIFNSIRNMLNYEVHSYNVPAFIGVEYGVYIQDVNGKLWKTEEWYGLTKPNAIAVIADNAKFRIALTQASLRMIISGEFSEPLEKYMMRSASSAAALSDYNGTENTANMLLAQPSIDYVAGHCNAFTFPNGKTKGYLPSFGQLNLAYKNKSAIDAALRKCGGAAMRESWYWSSTFWGVSSSFYRYCWTLRWSDGGVGYGSLNYYAYVRPFADF